MYTRQVAVMVDAGIPAVRAMQLYAETGQDDRVSRDLAILVGGGAGARD